MKFLLDTNIYSAFMRGQPAVANRVRKAERVLLSAVVAGELLFGFHGGRRYEKNWKELQAFLENPYVEFVPVTLVTADRFGRIAAQLRRKGTPIPTNDIWIAAHALELGAELLTDDDEHFRHVEGLVWSSPSRSG